MKRGDVYKITIDDVTVNAVCINAYCMDNYEENNGYTYYLCYAQNSLFHCIHNYYEYFDHDTEMWKSHEYWELGDTLVDYCVIPEFDEILKSYE